TMLAREGSTPAKLRKLKTDIPASRKITKTDLAKFLNAWDRKPHHVSFGAQKNFERFMAGFSNGEDQPEAPLPDVVAWKRMVAKALHVAHGHLPSATTEQRVGGSQYVHAQGRQALDPTPTPQPNLRTHHERRRPNQPLECDPHSPSPFLHQFSSVLLATSRSL